jgi:non-canonical (house-cleaning) NTP pyrophosphatase
VFPAKLFAKKINEWYLKYGHIIMGSANPNKIRFYKKYLKKILSNVDIQDITKNVPGGGDYFVGIGTDKNVMDRINKSLES